MNALRFVLKWVGIAIGLTILSLIGFFIAAWLTPGDPGRSYALFSIALLAATLAWRAAFREG